MKAAPKRNRPLSLIDVLNDPEGRRLVEAIEDADSSLRGYPHGDVTLERIRAQMVAELHATTGYFYSAERGAA